MRGVQSAPRSSPAFHGRRCGKSEGNPQPVSIRSNVRSTSSLILRIASTGDEDSRDCSPRGRSDVVIAPARFGSFGFLGESAMWSSSHDRFPQMASRCHKMTLRIINGERMQKRLIVSWALFICVVAPIGARQTPAIDWEKQKAEILQHYRALVQINSSSPPGNETKVVEYLKRVLENEGIPVKTFALD